MAHRLLALVATTALAGCGAAALASTQATDAPAGDPVEADDGYVGLVPGESMTFQVQLAGVLVGEASLAVGDVGDVNGHHAVVVKSRVATAGAARLMKHVDDESATVIDLATGLPLSYDSDTTSGDDHYSAHAEFVGHKVTVAFEARGKPAKRPTVLDFRDNPGLDSHAAMAMTRTWRGAPGDTRSLWVVGGRRMWRTDLTMRGSETIGTASGNRRAIRIDGIGHRVRGNLEIDDKRKPRAFTVWLSDDADRVPLLVQTDSDFGAVTIELLEYHAPGTVAAD